MLLNPLLLPPKALMVIGYVSMTLAFVDALVVAVFEVWRLVPMTLFCGALGVVSIVVAAFLSLAAACDEERRISWWAGRSAHVFSCEICLDAVRVGATSAPSCKCGPQ